MGTSYGINYPSVPLSDIQALRTLIGDQNSESFVDAEIQTFLSLSLVNGPGAEYFLAASLALRSLAAKKGTSLQEVRIGDFLDSSGRNQISALNATADAYYQKYIDTPAWGVSQEDLSDFNALIIIRNYVLRTSQ